MAQHKHGAARGMATGSGLARVQRSVAAHHLPLGLIDHPLAVSSSCCRCLAAGAIQLDNLGDKVADVQAAAAAGGVEPVGRVDGAVGCHGGALGAGPGGAPLGHLQGGREGETAHHPDK